MESDLPLELTFFDLELNIIDVYERFNYKELERRLLFHPDSTTQVEFLYDDPLLILRLKALGVAYAKFE